MKDFAELEEYFCSQNQPNWKRRLMQSMGYDIRDEMERQGISGLEMLGYFNEERGFSKEELLGVMGGQMLGGPALYNKIAYAMGLSFETLYTTTGLLRHGNQYYYPQAGEGGLDAVARARGRAFCANVGELWREQNPQSSTYESLYFRLGRNRHDFELIRTGKVPLKADDISKAAAACNTSNFPERISIPTRGVTGYPQKAIREDGTVDSIAFAYNLRMAMHIRLWEACYFCQKTGRTSKGMFDLMAGHEELSLEQVQIMADQLNLLEYHLLGEAADPAYSDEAGEVTQSHCSFCPGLQRQAVIAANIKHLLMKGGIRRSGPSADRSLCGAWMRICPEIPLSVLWGGRQAEQVVFADGQNDGVLARIASQLGVTVAELETPAIGIAETACKMRQEILSMLDREESVSRLQIALEMAQEETAQGLLYRDVDPH